ncbi:hypothetical protein [Dyella telluris]|uniref:Uncharacterized protein n=1 Tax=Dyella telluris TaxID=2763498 RepID=A0A7G8Q4P7_9GAMM|nr:hypothetical protein [Dyella telluris]QNK01755.1 hypothetical protein H8F01_00815 [Dyella telluris]
MITNNEIEALARRLGKLDAYGCCREAAAMLRALKQEREPTPLVSTEAGATKSEVAVFAARLGKGTAFLHFIELMAHDALMWRTLMEHSKSDHIWNHVLTPDHHKLGNNVTEVLLALADGKGND